VQVVTLVLVLVEVAVLAKHSCINEITIYVVYLEISYIPQLYKCYSI